MAVYVDETYYTDTYLGQDVGADFNRLASRASEDVDRAAGDSIDLDELTAFQVELVKKATCAQIEYYFLNGEAYNVDQSAGSEKIGGYERSVLVTQRRSPTDIAPRALDYLTRAGLTFRGVPRRRR
jgi:hypothetical protein